MRSNQDREKPKTFNHIGAHQMTTVIQSPKGKTFKIKGNSAYFKKKYGTPNPKIAIEDQDTILFGKSWMMLDGNPAAMLFGMRSGMEGIPGGGKVYYGKINNLGELVHESELEELTE